MPTLAATSSFETVEFLCSSCTLFCFNFSSRCWTFFFLFCDICGDYERCACENNTDKGFSSVRWGIQQELYQRYPAIVETWNKLGWKRPLEVIWSKLVLRASKLDQVARGFVQSCFEILQGRRLHSLSGQLCQWLTTDCDFFFFFLIFSQDFPRCRL